MDVVRTNIVIITYNALSYSRATLSSLFENTKTPYILTIVDNGSDLDTVNFLKQLATPDYCKKYNLILNKSNLGVGNAYNLGQQVSFSDGVEFTAFCNNDLYFSADWLTKLENRMDVNPNLAMLSPLRPSAKVWYDSKITTREALFRLEDTEDWRLELEQFTNCYAERFDDFCSKIVRSNGNGKLELISFPDSLSTCVCLTRNKVFTKMQRFADPIFSGYGGEDIDMSWTIMSLGYDCGVDHSVYVHHFRGKSLKANGMDRTLLLKRSNKILYNKWRVSIHKFIDKEITNGNNIIAKIKSETNGKYWLLHELNKDEHIIEEFIHA